jgi:beta-lactamase superfamily II metal-dependent hydrolase
VFNADKVLDFLAVENIGEVVLFLSHSDQDHTAGASAFVEGFQGRILGVFYNRDRLNAKAKSEYVRLIRSLGAFGKPVEADALPFLSASFDTNLNEIPRFGGLFPEGVNVRVLHPSYSDLSSLVGQDLNETAGVLMVEFREEQGISRRILLAADVQLTAISVILKRESEESLRADVLKFPHHGAWPEDWPGISFVEAEKRTMDDFLRAVAPSTVILSTGFDNSYGHVRPEVFQFFENYHKETGNLRSLKCTQFTTTCLRARRLPRRGLLTQPHCAGDVEVRMHADEAGPSVEVLTDPAEHRLRVARLNDVGKAGCAYLWDRLP